jgi:hypothetical protein
MIIGAMKFPNNIPNLNQILFSGLKILEFRNPKIKKIKLIKIAQILTSLSFNNGIKPIIKKMIKKTIPKLRLDPILIFFFINLLFYFNNFITNLLIYEKRN